MTRNDPRNHGGEQPTDRPPVPDDAAKRGRQAMEDIVREHGRVRQAFARRQAQLSPEDRQDLEQEMALGMWRALRHYTACHPGRSGTAAAAAYGGRAARNHGLNWRRGRRRAESHLDRSPSAEARVDPEDDRAPAAAGKWAGGHQDAEPSREAARRESRARVRQVWEELPPDERRLLVLWSEGGSWNGIGRELGISAKRARARWGRLRSTLHARFYGHGDE